MTRRSGRPILAILAVVAAGMVAGCSAPELPSCDALDVDTVEEYVGEKVHPQESSDEGNDVRVCTYDVLTRNKSSLTLMAKESDGPFNAFDPEQAEKTKSTCGQGKQSMVVDCHQGTVGGDSWCEVRDEEHGTLSVNVSWMHGELALYLALYVDPHDEKLLPVLHCGTVEDLAETVESALE